ncbi:MAG: DUF1501 domain-containing protein [Pirellulales bacterium]|nr:DUF1501 domain-containing protein [Pirellulales bacterium]
MLSAFDSRRRFARRQFLRVGGAALGGLSLAPLLAAEAREQRRLFTGKSVIFLFLHGGPSQFETFDPKMSAPEGIRSATGEIATALPGVTFGSNFPRLAALANRLAIVRSFTTGDANHDIKPIVGRATGGANLGSLFARVVGPVGTASGMPPNMLLVPRAVDPDAGPHQTQFGRFDATGELGAAVAPLIPGAGNDFQRDLELSLAPDRFDDRRAVLAALDRARWQFDCASDRTLPDPLRERAFATLLSGEMARAFDLSREDPRTIARYDTAPLVRPDQIDRKWNNYQHYVDNAKTLGKLLLLARRLCEAGCGFVTVTTNFVWDMHADVNNATMPEGMRYTAPPLDHAVSALVEDLGRRGLDQQILLICCGEMGRTPRINASGGRDHWGNLAPLLLAGGGLRMGQVIGRSTRDGGAPLSERIENRHLVATVLQTLVDPLELRTVRGLPDQIVQAANGDVIPGLM